MARNLDNKDGGLRATIPFRRVWCVDFEFQNPPGELPRPLCIVAKEFWTGETRRYGRNELLALRAAPFDTGSDAVMVAYLASAELGCFLELGWSLPENVLDLYVEHRAETNGLDLKTGNSLLGALALRDCAHIDANEKEAMYRLICDQNQWSPSEQQTIVDYCESDVIGLVALLSKMAGTIDWPRALYRGRYMAAVARIERTGVSVDEKIYAAMCGNWERVKTSLVNATNIDFGVYDGLTFKQDRFAAYLRQKGIHHWPRLPSGALDLKDDTFKRQAKLYPIVAPIWDVRQCLGRLRLSALEVGSDSRARAMLSPFRSLTGRNQPSASKFIFNTAKFLRGLVRPPEDHGLAYIDFASQENGIAGGLSGDERMIDAYCDGDPYLAFAKQAKLAPADATKESHKVIRDRCKEVVLGLNYGMGPDSMAEAAGITRSEALELITLHKRTYPTFWRWSNSVVDSAKINGVMVTEFGWKRHVKARDRATSLMNFPMQSGGAEMMRIAAIAATEAGIEVCAPVHDAFLIAAPLDCLDEHVALMCELMSKAGSVVADGVPIRTDAKVIRYPDRYMDDRGLAMWNRIVGLIGHVEARM